MVLPRGVEVEHVDRRQLIVAFANFDKRTTVRFGGFFFGGHLGFVSVFEARLDDQWASPGGRCSNRCRRRSSGFCCCSFYDTSSRGGDGRSRAERRHQRGVSHAELVFGILLRIGVKLRHFGAGGHAASTFRACGFDRNCRCCQRQGSFGVG